MGKVITLCETRTPERVKRSLNKICFLAGTLGQGGAEQQLFYILRELKQKGVNLRLFSLSRGEFWEQPIKELGVPVIWVGQRKSRLARLACLTNELRKDLPDIIQSQHFYTNIYSSASARILGIREVGAIRSTAVSEVRENGIFLGRLNLLLPRRLAVNSECARQNALSLGVSSRRLFLLPSVVDTERFKPGPGHRDKTVRILAAGRLVKEKRFDRFLSVLARAVKSSPVKIKGIIAGEGCQREELEKEAKDLGLLPDLVEFKGAVPDMAPVYQDADIAVLTSDYEGIPNVALEAMSSGLALIALRAGGIAEVVKDKLTGYLIDSWNEERMQEALLELIGNSGLRLEMGRRAREYIETYRSLLRLSGILEDFYRALLLPAEAID